MDNRIVPATDKHGAVISQDDMLAAIKRAIDGSIPYIAAHKAFMITEESWNELAAIVYPTLRKFDEAIARMDFGEKLTEAEIREIFS